MTMEHASDTTKMSWSSILKHARNHAHNEGSNTDFYMAFGESIARWSDQIYEYLRSRRQRALLEPASSAGPDDEEKKIILETRAALRFGICCLSIDSSEERTNLQRCMVLEHKWHVPLATLLSYQQQRVDSKCRLFAARLFTNLITANQTTAHELVSFLPISPARDQISSKILNTMTESERNVEMEDDDCSWVDMLITASREANQRETLAAVTAALYNCLIALDDKEADDNPKLTFGRKFASDSMLISTLLRQFVSVNAINPILNPPTKEKTPKDTGTEESELDNWDSATEWIHLLLVQLIRLGLLRDMYMSIYSKESSTSRVLPEQIVLLHCAAQEAHSYATSSSMEQDDSTFPLGGEGGKEVIKATFLFLSELFCQHCHSHEENLSSELMDAQLARSAALSSIDIIASALGVDNSETCAMVRLELGSKTDLIPQASRLLGTMVDDLTERSNRGVKTRDLTLSQEEQKWMTTLVRLQGNLCFQCRFNQDMLRTTLVPTTKSALSSENEQNETGQSRNALHVLLSCTTFATSCFTLREWGVLAIRNVLEDNVLNQETVAKLNAQNAVQTSALNQAGMRVSLNQNGKVSLSPLEEKEEE